MFEPCTKTVSILYALIFGAGDACIEISAVSILSAFAIFMVGVVILQFFARRLWNRLVKGQPTAKRRIGTIYDDTPDDDDKFKDSAVWSARK